MIRAYKSTCKVRWDFRMLDRITAVNTHPSKLNAGAFGRYYLNAYPSLRARFTAMPHFQERDNDAQNSINIDYAHRDPRNRRQRNLANRKARVSYVLSGGAVISGFAVWAIAIAEGKPDFLPSFDAVMVFWLVYLGGVLGCGILSINFAI